MNKFNIGDRVRCFITGTVFIVTVIESKQSHNGVFLSMVSEDIMYSDSSKREWYYGCDLVKVEPHVPAELMLQYARDAAGMPDPWKRWEYMHEGQSGWGRCLSHPRWNPSFQYRRICSDQETTS